MEHWKQIPIAPAYEVSNTGVVRCIFNHLWKRRGKPRKTWNIRGYQHVVLHVDGVRKAFSIHRLVMAAFVGPSDLHVNHINGDKADNRPENLEYVTAAQNRAHAKHVLDAYPKGSGHPNAKLTEDNVRSIRALIASGHSDQEIGSAFACTAANIYVIRKGKGWTHVT